MPSAASCCMASECISHRIAHAFATTGAMVTQASSSDSRTRLILEDLTIVTGAIQRTVSEALMLRDARQSLNSRTPCRQAPAVPLGADSVASPKLKCNKGSLFTLARSECALDHSRNRS